MVNVVRSRKGGKIKIQRHLLIRLAPLPVVLEVGIVSGLRTESPSILFFTSAGWGLGYRVREEYFRH